MGRKTNTFPSYRRIEVQKGIPKDYYTVGVWRCANCETYWPKYAEFSTSPCCDASTTFIAEPSPHMTYSEAMRQLIHARFRRWYHTYNEGVTDEELYYQDPISDELDDEAVADVVSKFDELVDSREPVRSEFEI